MRRRWHMERMSRVAEVRDVQESAAKMRVGQVQAALGRLNEERHESVATIAAEEAQWAAAVAGVSLDLQAARAWRGSVQARQVELGALDQRIGVATVERRHESEEWRQAIARADVARTLAEEAAKALARHREEAALSDAADRFVQQRGRQ